MSILRDVGSDRFRAAAVGGMVIGAAVIVLGAFLPWVLSGSTTRSSFATVRTADRLGLVPDGAALALVRSWYLVPLVAALIPLLIAFHRVRAAAVVGILLAVLTGGVAGLVLVAAPPTGAGPAVCLTAALVVLASAIGLLVDRRGTSSSNLAAHR